MNSDSEDEFDGGINFGANPHSQQISTLSGKKNISEHKFAFYSVVRIALE